MARLLTELPCEVDAMLVEKGRVLDNFYVPTRCANGHPEGPPFEHYGPLQSAEAIDYAGQISLNSSVFAWPSQDEVVGALAAWVPVAVGKHPDVTRLGYFGSYARGDWGVGSDLDLVAIVEASDAPFHHRSIAWDLHALPVPAELLVYTQPEWDRLLREGGRFAAVMTREVKWLYTRPRL